MTVSGGPAGHFAHTSSGVRNSPAHAPDPPVVRPRLGEKFEITGRHAEGATCEVFKAHHVALDIGVAVKVLRPGYASEPRYLERMRIEAQVLPRLKSRHIVQCFDRGVTEDGRPFTVLEFLRGETLEALLEKAGTFDELTTVEVGVALFDALSAAHARGVVHRDVTLRNLIVHRADDDAPTLKLIDFGFAWIMPDAPESAPEPAESPERDIAVGTPRFMAPEVVLGRVIDARADLYSAGVVLYCLLAGRDPFAELRTPEAVLDAHAHRTVPPLSLHAPGVSNELEAVVMRLLASDPADRFVSARVAAEALLEVAHAGKCAPAPLAPSVREISSPPRAPVPSIRGAFISPSRSWIIATYGRDVYEASVATLADEHRSVFTGELISVLWYPLEPWTAILGQVRKHAWRVRGESETTFDRRHLHETIGTTLTKVYRTDLGLFDPQAIVAKVTPLLRRIYSHGDYEVVENREGRCVLRFRDAPVQMLPELQRSFPLAASWMLEIAGQEVTRQDLAPMVRAGMFSCVLTLQYRPKAPARGASEPVGVVVALPSHRNLVTRIVGRILLLCENMKTPSDEEWNECLKLLEQLKRAERLPAVLVITDGGGPNAAQREALRRALNSQPIRVAVISDSPKVRFVSAAVALMNKGQKGFKRCEMPQAHAYLGLEPQGAQAAERAIAEMVVQLDSSARA